LQFGLIKECIIEKAYLLKISPNPSLPKREIPPFWQREGRRDLVSDVYIITDSLVIIRRR
jgi:hypothetical protein